MDLKTSDITDEEIARMGKLMAAGILKDAENRMMGTFFQPTPPPDNFVHFSYLNDPFEFKIEPTPYRFNPWAYGGLIVNHTPMSLLITACDCGEDYTPERMSPKAHRAGKNWNWGAR